MGKPSEHAAKAMAYQREADALLADVDPHNSSSEEMQVNYLSAIESRLAALTEALLATVPPVIMRNAGRPDSED